MKMAVQQQGSPPAGKKPSGVISSAMFKWLAGIASSVAAALLIWWLTSPGGLLNSEAPEQNEPSLPVMVRLEVGNGIFQRAFFTPRGQIVTMANDILEGKVTAVWWENGGERRARAEIVDDRGVEVIDSEAMLLRLIDEDPPTVDFGIRRAKSLQPGEIVESFLGPTQRSPGKVVEVYATREIAVSQGLRLIHDLLVTTRMAGTLDSGIPLLDSDDQVVGMIFAGNSESIAVPIETIQADFPSAF
jgi:hypothetical protein